MAVSADSAREETEPAGKTFVGRMKVKQVFFGLGTLLNGGRLD
jgi:hypothetical protein